MSFNYSHLSNNPLGNSIAPMHLMGNLAPNGGNFLPQLSSALLPQMSGQSGQQLEFNLNTTAAAGPMDLETVNERERDARNKRTNHQHHQREQSADNKLDDCDVGKDQQSPSSVSNLGLVQNNELVFNGMLGMPPQGFMMMPGVMMDPALLGIQQFPLLNQLSNISPSTVSSAQESSNNLNVNSQSTSETNVKEVIQCKSCTLIPPNPNAPPPTTRERPPGCRTVFVGGLPENITEAIIHEIFERCGEITTLRLSKKNFCHIRFVFEASVDSAIYLSGYRIRIGNNQDAPNSGRLHVDYAQARDDQYEYECRQRQLQREQRHRERLEKDRLRPLSPPPIVHYTEHEATSVAEKIKSDESFSKACQILITWLERGDCNKKNANTFYSMIQSTNSHVRRLLNDKNQYEDDLRKARNHYKKQMQSMLVQFTQIEKVFNAASHKKVWDHFTKAQRKNIDMWCKQSMDIRTVQLDEVQDNDEMEISDDDRDTFGPNPKRTKWDNDKLKEENDSLRCQLQAYKNEVDLVKSDIKSDSDFKNKQIKVLQETIRNLQKKLFEFNGKEKENEIKINELEQKLKEANVKELLLKTKIANTKMHTTQKDDDDSLTMGSEEALMTDTMTIGCDSDQQESKDLNKRLFMSTENAKIISLITSYLVIHPFGAHLDNIQNYIQQFIPNIKPKVLFDIMDYYSNLFHNCLMDDNVKLTNNGAKIVDSSQQSQLQTQSTQSPNILHSKWMFCGFKK